MYRQCAATVARPCISAGGGWRWEMAEQTVTGMFRE